MIPFNKRKSFPNTDGGTNFGHVDVYSAEHEPGVVLYSVEASPFGTIHEETVIKIDRADLPNFIKALIKADQGSGLAVDE